MHELYEKHGFYHNKTVSLSYPGADGAAKMAGIMAGLRENPPELAGSKIEAVVDYNTCVNGLPRADVIEFDLEGGNKAIVRPSGTEPKIKLYIFARARMPRLMPHLTRLRSPVASCWPKALKAYFYS